MKKSSFLLLLLLSLVNISHAQCDTLLQDQLAPEGFKLNAQSHVRIVEASADFELCLVLSPGVQYEFQILGHRDFEVYLKSNLSFYTDKTDKIEKHTLLTNREEKDGVFRIQPDHVQRIYVRQFGVLEEEGDECVGVNVFEKK